MITLFVVVCYDYSEEYVKQPHYYTECAFIVEADAQAWATEHSKAEAQQGRLYKVSPCEVLDVEVTSADLAPDFVLHSV